MRTIGGLCAAVAAAFIVGTFAGTTIAAEPERQSAWQLPALPTVTGPIPVTADSRPFLGAAEELAAVGYVEEEFFISGLAHTYDWDGDGTKVKVVAGPGRYTTRILVRRPKDPKRFGGNIELNILNATTLVDRGSPLDFERMVKDGDVWIGITSKSLTAGTLKKFDPERYAALDWSNPASPDQRCQYPSIIPLYTMGDVRRENLPAFMRDPTQEDGLIWDMIGQLGLLLKSDQRSAILPGFAKPKIFMTGISQSSLLINTWMVAFHDLYRTPDAKPAFDGYMPIVGANMLRINQCSVDVPAQDPRSRAPLLDVPIVKVLSEAEMNLGRYTRRPNVIQGRTGVVTYEIAGAPHSRGEIPGRPRKTLNPPASDVAKALAGIPVMPRPALPAGEVPNDFPWAPTLRAAFNHLKQWANEGVAPPQTPDIQLDATLNIVRDRHGNALGGLRLPYIDVPIAQYKGAIAMEGHGSIIGSKIPFDSAKLKALYPDHETYVRKFVAATDAALEARLILPEDAEQMKLAAQEAAIP